MKEITLKNPDAPMSFRQGLMIRNAGGGDVRGEGLTMQQASDRIRDLLQAKATEKVDVRDGWPSTFEFGKLLAKANQEGVLAAKACIPAPMIVSGYEDQPVMDGPCGFAWVNFKMKSGLARKFGKWLKDNGHGRKDEYYGGVTIWIGDYGQSMERKAAHAGAMVKVFQEAGIDAHMMSRMD